VIKAVLFDFDGVIVDSFEAWRSAVNDALLFFSHDPISPERFRKEFWGIELRESIKKLGLGEEAVEMANRNYFRHLDKVRLKEDVREVLEEVRKRCKTALVTNTPREIISFLLKSFQLENLFEAVVTGDEVKLGKPHPDGVLKTCEILGVKPEEAVLVGDTRSDVLAGRSAGCRAVIGLGVSADFTISSLIELLEVLKVIDGGESPFSRNVKAPEDSEEES